jgi:hypothetical protein
VLRRPLESTQCLLVIMVQWPENKLVGLIDGGREIMLLMPLNKSPSPAHAPIVFFKEINSKLLEYLNFSPAYGRRFGDNAGFGRFSRISGRK